MGAEENKIVELKPDLEQQSPNLEDPELYFEREISLLRFNWRVLRQALDESMPLLERIRFVCICSNNLDEFFEVRVAGLRHRIDRGDTKPSLNGESPEETLNNIRDFSHRLVEEQYQILNEQLLPKLEAENIRFLLADDWSDKQKSWLKKYFKQQIMPVISPISLDLAHPFPRLVNKSLHFLVHLHGNDAFGRDLEYAILHMPRSLPRIIELPDEIAANPGQDFVYLSSIISVFAEDLFPGMEINGCYQFRLTRDSDLLVDEQLTDDLASALKRELQSRHFGAAVRLEVEKSCPNKLVNFLLQKCNLTQDELYLADGPVNLNRLMSLPDLVERADLKFTGFTPKTPKDLKMGRPVLEVLQENDIFLHHPYQSFVPVIEFVKQAASDPEVLAMKQTLYRTGSDSPIVAALIDAAHAGKEVTAVIELRARFDEEDNIELAQKLQEAGVLVVYGVVGYKTHAKMSLVVRRFKKKLVRFVHLGTGNYHERNARLYTDYSLLTSDKEIGEDVHKVFQQLTGMGKVYKLNKLWNAPFNLHKKLIKNINHEIAIAESGEPAEIILKVNALTDPQLIMKLYQASMAGVQVRLLVRGICCLRPDVAGVSDNIEVTSIIGRFLEHSRVYYFSNGGDSNLYAASADIMERNLYHRVEVAFPILDPDAKQQVIKDLRLMLRPHQQSWRLSHNGLYEIQAIEDEYKVQDRLLEALAL
ncbi:polyphosphate kinase 1 [Kangiella sp. TOML190]|uniref:polyphosphate kinase 1 n=1 Tax=Kangiella sp. TOML190 TaxID=2931351 RepID=UPI00203B762D|nr:polyphosphate kinase 1 [Kangiella sp. TOML190]